MSALPMPMARRERAASTASLGNNRDVRPLFRLFLGTVALVALYFAVPVDTSRSVALRAILTFVCLAVATWLIFLEVRHQASTEGSPLWGLALAVVGGVLAFAMLDYVVAF